MSETAEQVMICECGHTHLARAAFFATCGVCGCTNFRLRHERDLIPTWETAAPSMPVEVSGHVDGVPFTVRVGGPSAEVESPDGLVRLTPTVDHDGFSVRVCAEIIEERTDEPNAMIEPAISAEQQARDLLERIGVENAQSFSSGDLVELANIIAGYSSLRKLITRERCRGELR